MKNFLLASACMLCFVASKAQNVYLNEVFTSPSAGNHEYFELYNESIATSGEDLSNYTLVSYYITPTGERGFYVLNLPNQTIAPQGYFVGSSQDFFSYPGGDTTARYSWNNALYLAAHSGSTVKYSLNASNTGYTTTTGTFDNIFTQTSGQNPKTSVYAIFLFYNGVYQDGILGSSPNKKLPQALTEMAALPASSMNGATAPISLSDLASVMIENVPQTPDQNGGYFRTKDGISCGGKWAITNGEPDFTPGATNGRGNQIGADVTFECGSTTFTYDITNAPNPAFPIVATLYYDVNGNGVLDASDAVAGTRTELSVSDPAFTFAVVADVSLLLVFDASTGNSCSNRILSFSCGTGGPLPVNLLNFDVVKRVGSIELNWQTSMESNNRGFEIQRRTNNQFESIGFVNSIAKEGYSNITLSYKFNDDEDLASGIVYYRLRQLDYDGKSSYSDVKAIRNNTNDVSVTVYPNPSNGNAKLIVPTGVGNLDITVIDIQGRLINRYSNFTGSRLDINNLKKGVYMVRVLFKESGQQIIQKLVVMN